MTNESIKQNVLGIAKHWQTGFQEACSPVMQDLDKIHNLFLVIAFGIGAFVLFLLLYIVWRFREKKNKNPATFSHNLTIEIVWTLIPIIILVIIGVPSIKLINKMELPVTPDLTIKATGSQWYWTYEYELDSKDAPVIKFDSYMIEDKHIKANQFRLLDVDNPVIVPVNQVIKVIVTASDVIHSFAVPALGVKKDGIPGRINETWFKITKEGVYYGQCSELCGIKHGFMPIKIQAVSKQDYEKWLKEHKQKQLSGSNDSHKVQDINKQEVLDNKK